MPLYVLRHAIAVERGSPDYAADDSARPLTEDGIQKMRRGARGIRRMGLDFDLILTSPYRRARQTAEIVADALDALERMEIFSPLAADVAPEEAVAQAAERAAGSESVLLVGHEPQLSEIGSILLAGNTELGLQLKKGGLFKLECSRIGPGSGTLEWWLTAKQLRQLAD